MEPARGHFSSGVQSPEISEEKFVKFSRDVAREIGLFILCQLNDVIKCVRLGCEYDDRVMSLIEIFSR